MEKELEEVREKLNQEKEDKVKLSDFVNRLEKEISTLNDENKNYEKQVRLNHYFLRNLLGKVA